MNLTEIEYGFFYPENNERFLASMSWSTPELAADWFRYRRPTWQEITATPPAKYAFLNPIVGDIVVVRVIAKL